METLNFKVLSLLVETGSTMAGEIRTEFGAANPHRCIAELRKIGYPICDCRIWGNEKVYYLPPPPFSRRQNQHYKLSILKK